MIAPGIFDADGRQMIDDETVEAIAKYLVPEALLLMLSPQCSSTERISSGVFANAGAAAHAAAPARNAFLVSFIEVFTEARIPAPSGAVSLAYKSPGTASVVVSAHDPTGGFFCFSTGQVPGDFFFQICDVSGNILREGSFTVRQDLAHAAANYDPRSEAAKTLEALEAKIAGRALTIQQSKITVGDRAIEYMNSIEELLKWRDHFARLVAKEQGKETPTAQVCVLRRS